jgi:hypothetical protein
MKQISWLAFLLCVTLPAQVVSLRMKPQVVQQQLSIDAREGVPVDAHPSSDLIATINAMAATCDQNCTIRIPAGDYTLSSGTILIRHNGVSLIGDGRNNTIIHYSGLNFLDSRLNATTYGPSFAGSGTIGGFTVYCSNPNARCITGGSVIGQRWQDLSVIGPGGITGSPPAGANAEGFTFQNTYDWMERTVFRDITIGGFTTNFHFLAPNGGTDSFGYMLFDGIWTNQGPGSKSFVVDPGAAVYNTLGFTMQFNSGGTSLNDDVFSIGGAFTGVGFHVTGENAGAPITFAHILCGGHMEFEGDYNIFGGQAVADCPQTVAGSGDAFRITPSAGMTGISGSLAGLPSLENTTSLGLTAPQTLNIWPYQDFDRNNPYAVAYTGFVANPQGRVSPVEVYDQEVPWCVAARGIYQAEGQIYPKLCLSGNGDLVAAGTIQGAAVQTTRGTPASSHDACVPGESWDDDNFHYHCASNGEIKRMALANF